MDIEIRRNRDISFNVTCENPEALKDLVPELTDQEKRLQEECDARLEELEDEFWRFVKEHPIRDCSGDLIKPETHEIGFDFSDPDDDGVCEAETMWVRPKKSEYEKWAPQ